MSKDNFVLPEFAVDCHTHIFDPARFAYSDGPGFHPPDGFPGTAAEQMQTITEHGFTHGLLVQPSAYGVDNRAILHAISLASDRLKGIAEVSSQTDEHELDKLQAQGIVGIRFNFDDTNTHTFDQPMVRRQLAWIKHNKLFVDVHLASSGAVDGVDVLCDAGVRLIIDHLGRPNPALGLDQPKFQQVLRIGREADSVVKLSAFFRISESAFPYANLDPFIAALLETYTPSRCIFASDWPFVRYPAHTISYADQVAALPRWIPDQQTFNAITWENPARLFGFKPLAK